MPIVTQEVYLSMGLRRGEYDLIVQLMGREPSLSECGMFSVMWSEHCGYKYSRPILSAFRKYREALEGDGLENAGIIEIAPGLGITMKVESHNHPSAVEPYQGAATGVGGIIRDILTMGARPIASLNSLRFGPIEDGKAEEATLARNRFIVEGVVAGIAGYGNCVGVPTVGGEVDFDPLYSGNPLVNAMCVGVIELDKVTTASAQGVGNSVLYLGSSTGKDGIHGATFASEELSEDSDQKRPNVQIGDPFAEKQLIEATLEALATGAIVAIQDMGAAGLTCSTVEMAAKGKVGMEIDLDLVPMRENDMTAYELLLSESQERMLAVVHAGREEEVFTVFRKWGIPAAKIGFIATHSHLVIRRWGEVEADIDPTWLADHCPTYTTEGAEPAVVREAREFQITSIPEVPPLEALKKLLACPTICSKRWVYQQYDQQVQTQTVAGPAKSDAAVLAVRGPDGQRTGVAVTLDGNSRYVRQHPWRGGLLAVVEAARNIACSGAVPRGITDGLNYGSPENGEVYWQFRESVNAIANAAEVLQTPVVSGNVSFYNRSELGEIPPTPLIGMVGVLESIENYISTSPNTVEGTELWLLEAEHGANEHMGLGASIYLSEICGGLQGMPTEPNLNAEIQLCKLLAEGGALRILESAHDLSDGGLLVSAVEVALGAQAGLNLDLRGLKEFGRSDAALFGEIPGRVLVGVSSSRTEQLQQLAEKHHVDVSRVGHFTQDGQISVLGPTELSTFTISLTECNEAFEGTLPKCMSH